MRNAGLSIESLIDYLALFRVGDQTVPARVELLKERYDELAERIQLMQSALDRLTYKIENYDTHMLAAEKNLKKFE